MFSELLTFLAGFFKPVVESALAAFAAQKTTIIGEVDALENADAPAVAAVLEKYIPVGGFFGTEIKSLIVGWITSKLPGLLAEGQAAQGAWFDALVALLESEAAKLGL